MKPYGHNAQRDDDMRDQSSTGARPGVRKTSSRRVDKKTTRAKDKAALAREQR